MLIQKHVVDFDILTYFESSEYTFLSLKYFEVDFEAFQFGDWFEETYQPHLSITNLFQILFFPYKILSFSDY